MQKATQKATKFRHFTNSYPLKVAINYINTDRLKHENIGIQFKTATQQNTSWLKPGGKQIQNRKQTIRALHSIDWAPVGRNMEDLLRITVEQIARVAITDILSSRDRKRTPALTYVSLELLRAALCMGRTFYWAVILGDLRKYYSLLLASSYKYKIEKCG